MADNDKVLMVHKDVKDDDGKPIAVEVTQAEFESVWRTVGWTLQPKKKEN